MSMSYLPARLGGGAAELTASALVPGLPKHARPNELNLNAFWLAAALRNMQHIPARIRPERSSYCHASET
jgi:hypothetical protein